MTSNERLDEAYVWIWLPGETVPVVAGLLSRDGGDLVFNYGRSYLERDNRIPIYEPELPLVPGIQHPGPGLQLPSCIGMRHLTPGDDVSSSTGASVRNATTSISISSTS